MTSATRSDRLGKHIGLGYVKRPFNKTGLPFEACDPKNDAAPHVRVELVDLPFAPREES